MSGKIWSGHLHPQFVLFSVYLFNLSCIYQASWNVISMALDCVEEISAVRLKLPQKLDSNTKGVIEQMIKVSVIPDITSFALNSLHVTNVSEC